MRKLALLLLLLPFVALGVYACDEAHNPLEAESQASETPLFAPKSPKAEPNPIGCTQDQVAKWDETSGEWVCAEDLVGGSTGPTVYYLVYSTTGNCNGTATGNLGTVLPTGDGSLCGYAIQTTFDASNCAAVATQIDANNRMFIVVQRAGDFGFEVNHVDLLTWESPDASFSMILACP